VYGIGKIEDIFAHKGITKSNHAAGNPLCIEAALAAQAEDYEGLLFVNLVDTDMLFGHRRDVQGYADALAAFDASLPEFIAQMGPEDLLILTADHGCDPMHKGTDHTREYIPLLVYGKTVKGGVNLHVRETFADISATILDAFGIENTIHGTSFLNEIRA
jgi:phosphopentomutase